MQVLEIECDGEEKDRLIAEFWERGTAGVIEEDLPAGRCRLQAFFAERLDLPGRWSEQEERDWVAVAQSQWQPLLVGQRFFLAPPWRADPTPAGRIRLEMQPGMACGTGWHPATQLALEALERWLRPGAAVLDLGTGSGLLAVAAARLGAGRLYACDIDAEAAAAAGARFKQEQIEVGLFAGSLRSLPTALVDLVVANINAETLAGLAPEILRVLKPEGTAILSGFPERHLARIQAAFPGACAALRRQDWVAVILTRR